jgi:Tfp pilus assembly protein PilV
MSRLRRNPRAFSLIEVMMGATILVVGFIGLIQAITLNSAMLDTARKQQIAAQIIDGEFEALHSASWSSVSALADGTTYTITVDSAGNASGSTSRFELDNNTQLLALAGGFQCSLTSSWLRPSGASAGTVTFLKITCSVTWTGNTGHVYTRSTDAYFGKYGLNLSYQKS